MEGESLVPDSTIGRILVAVDQKEPSWTRRRFLYNTSVEADVVQKVKKGEREFGENKHNIE